MAVSPKTNTRPSPNSGYRFYDAEALRNAYANGSRSKGRRRPKKKRRRSPFGLIVFCLFLSAALLVVYLSARPPGVKSITAGSAVNEDMTVTIEVALQGRLLFSGEMYGALSQSNEASELGDAEWQQAADGVLRFNASAGDYYIFTKNSIGSTSSAYAYTVAINEVVALQLGHETVYLPLGGADTLETTSLALGDADETIRWQSSDPAVVTVDSAGNLAAQGIGQATVTASTQNGLTASSSVIVSDLFQPAELDNSKTSVSYASYTEEENDLLDSALAYRVARAGTSTRAGAVAAARFLALEFPYQIPYFFENGRLNNYSEMPYVDGEGRYYHIGLYLNESRFDDIEATFDGPAVWGQELYSLQTEEYDPNGLSCGGFVSWCLLNAGFDPGDSGSGDYADRDDDLCDLGEKTPLTKELMASGQVKVGDLLFLQGHIAIIIGLDETNVYVAESWEGTLHVDVYERYSGLVNNSQFTHVTLMDEFYGQDGALTDYWD